MLRTLIVISYLAEVLRKQKFKIQKEYYLYWITFEIEMLEIRKARVPDIVCDSRCIQTSTELQSLISAGLNRGLKD